MKKEQKNTNMPITEEKLHAYKAEQARRKQLQDFEDELFWADRIPPSPRMFSHPYPKKEYTSWFEVLSTIDYKRFLKIILP